MLEEEKNIKFPEQHYLALRQETLHGEVRSTGFITPYGTDSAAKKRMSTVDIWFNQGIKRSRFDPDTKQYIQVINESTPKPTVIDNTAQYGFAIERRLNRGGSWNGSPDKWKIEDPRGYQLEISGNNLQKIIEYTDIKNGVIQGECIWARMGSENILVPCNTEIYANAAKNTARVSQSVSVKDMKPGNWVVLQNGQEGQYLGMYYLISKLYYNPDKTSTDFRLQYLTTSKKKRYIFRGEGDQYFSFATPKISSLRDCIEPVLTEEEINHQLTTTNKTINGAAEDGNGVTSLANPAHTIVWTGNVPADYDKGHTYVFNQIGEHFAGSYRSWKNPPVEKSSSLYDMDLKKILDKIHYGHDGTPRPYAKQGPQIKEPYCVASFLVDTGYGQVKIKI